jgi:3-isopropylmalate/(R)-2-methylmalate dehydratase small subunit
MHSISPARLKPGVTADDLPAPVAATDTHTGARLVRGKALIFWDPKAPPKTKKLDAIDTDQITPAADCVSESLETLDERWKAGSFRYLMPDFRKRVHAGETFIIAGDRFAIGSSREMSPAGLKAVAEEVGREMVVVCGNNMGDIFRRNSFNLGLHVVQCPEAVADANDGDQFTFDPDTRAIENVTQGKRYTAVPLSAKEEEIRRDGGIFAVGRREFRASVVTPPSLDWPDASVARDMTTTEQSSGRTASTRTCGAATSSPARRFASYADLLPASDGTAPFSIHTFNQITGGDTIFRARPRSPTTTSSSPAAKTTTSRRRSDGRSRRRMAWRSRTTRRPAMASSTSISPNRGWCCLDSSFPARTRTAVRTAPTARSASASARRRSASAGRPATSTSRSQEPGGSRSPDD